MKLFYVNMQYTYSYSIVYSRSRRTVFTQRRYFITHTLLFEQHPPMSVLPVFKLHSTFSIFIVKINP